MTDKTNEPDPTPADETPADPAPAPAPQPASPAEPKTRWRDRAFGFRGVVAVALATLILGGVGGAAIGVVASGDGDRHGPARMEFRDGDRPTHGGPGMPGFGTPPATSPQDEVQPDDSGDSSSNS